MSSRVPRILAPAQGLPNRPPGQRGKGHLRVRDFGFRLLGVLGYRVSGFRGFRVLGFRGLGFRIEGLGFRVTRCRVYRG